MRLSLVPALAITLAIAVADAASAATLTVNSTGDQRGDCEPAGGGVCTLREAIFQANADAGPDTIEFSIGSGLQTISPTSGLPRVQDDETSFRGDTQPGSGTTPRIELNGSLLADSIPGLEIKGDDAVIFGLAINDFEGPGILVHGADRTTIQGNYIGTDDTATVAEPNSHGVRIKHLVTDTGSVDAAEGARIGGEPGAGNVISGNDVAGVSIVAIPGGGDAGPLEIQGNMIGTSATGLSPIGNGLMGVQVAEPTLIGDPDNAAPELANVIAHNGAKGGVSVQAGEGTVVARNSIFSNGGIGIDLAAAGVVDGVTANDGAPDSDAGANGLQNYPILDAVAATEDGTLQAITGTLFTAPGSYEAQFYVSDECDPSGNGEGQRPLGSATIVVDANGEADFSAVPEGVAGAQVFPGQLVTATVSGPEGTSEFSPCVLAAPPVVVGEQVVAGPVGDGTVLVKPAGANAFEPLVGSEQISVGSVLNTRAGEVRIVSQAPGEAGGTREAIFSEGKFKVKQSDEGKFTTTVRLVGPDPCDVAKAARGGIVNKVRSKSKRRRHRSRGRHAAGSVRGTEWLTEERCAGTYFEVFEGTVLVKEFATGNKIRLDAGESYLAKPSG